MSVWAFKISSFVLMATSSAAAESFDLSSLLFSFLEVVDFLTETASFFSLILLTFSLGSPYLL
jgi:hypothetical protein